MSKILLQNVSKVFDAGITAVDNVTLDVNDGEFMVIAGPTGCGKTTILRCIAGLESMTTGDIYFDDVLVNRVSPRNRDIAMVFQDHALYPHMTVCQNLAFGLKVRKYSQAQINNRITKVVELLGIGELLDRKPKALSGGERQRVALGRAIVRDPRAFLYDEPLSHMDAASRATTRAELKALHQRLHATSIYVTHDQAEAMTLADRMCILHHGVVQQVAAPQDVYNRPANKFVAHFLGTPPMNFFPGFIRRIKGNICFAIGQDTIILPNPLRNKCEALCDQHMSLGVRPEHLSLQQCAPQAHNVIPATVTTLEYLGDRTLVRLTTHSGVEFVAGTNAPPPLQPNDAVQVYVDLKNIHVFWDSKAGENMITDVTGTTL